MNPPTPAEALDLLHAVIRGDTFARKVVDVRPALAVLRDVIAGNERVQKLLWLTPPGQLIPRANVRAALDRKDPS